MVSATKIAAAVSVTAIVAGLGYVFYFDYKRRNDPKFRRQLKRDRKRVAKTVEKVSHELSLEEINEKALELLNVLGATKLPDTPAQKEAFFMEHVSRGETLCSAGPAQHAAAACSFYQALRVYPNPVELVMIYQKTTPEPVFKLVMAMMAQEVKKKHARYLDVFPPADANVRIKDKGKAAAKPGVQDDVVVSNRALFATKAVDAGEIVYEEDSVVSTLLPCTQNGQFCSHCLKAIASAQPRAEKQDTDAEKQDADAEKEDGEVTEDGADEPASSALKCDKCDEAVYCSERCRQDAADAYHQFLCPGGSNSGAAREFIKLTRDSHELAPILIAKFFGVLVDREKKKELERVLGGGASGSGSEADEYTTWEHLEWMRYLELVPSPTDARMLDKLGELVSASVPGLTEFVSGDRYTMLKGKLDFNAYAVHASSNAEVPAETEETHVSDTMRDDHSARAVGLSLYLISSHIAHHCDPNVQIVFPTGTNKAAIKALRPIAADEELRVAFVDPSLDCETRRKQLRESYRISCACDKCEADLAAAAAAVVEVSVAETPAAEEPAAEEPAAEEPAAKEPAAEEPVAEQPVAEETAAEETAAEEPAAEESAVEEPAAEEPVANSTTTLEEEPIVVTSDDDE
ncbi:mitochondrial import receptor subunit tom20 [Coemansia spiralis]|nr:mitochondrial import receptor subunit tom20 [Coemansia spiralis]